MANPDSETKNMEEEIEIVEEEEVEEEEEVGEEAVSESKKMAVQLMKNPQVLAALQDKMGSADGSLSAFLQSLSKPVRRRIKALKKLQNAIIEDESRFYKEVHELECKYADKYAAIYEKRSAIVAGAHEPNDDDCDWPSDDEKDEDDEENEIANELKNKAVITKEDGDKEDGDKEEDVKGVPGFWLTIFKNIELLQEMVQTHDEPILNHLMDIKLKFLQGETQGFTLEFHFQPNDYFKETVLTKQYVMRFEPDPLEPLCYEGPEIIKCVGCGITWNKGKNVTVKTIKKKQKHKGKGTSRTVIKTVSNDSFFNFFSPPEVPEGENEDDMDDDMEALLAADYEIGHFIREHIISRAVLYFTGEAVDSEYDEEEEEETEGDDDEINYEGLIPTDQA